MSAAEEEAAAVRVRVLKHQLKHALSGVRVGGATRGMHIIDGSAEPELKRASKRAAVPCGHDSPYGHCGRVGEVQRESFQIGGERDRRWG